MARSASALRGQILEAALELFAAGGYRGTSLHDIAVRVGCSKASLLYHFTSKDAILTELLAPAGEALAALDAELDGLPDDRAATAAVTGYVDLALRFRREVKVLFQDINEMTAHPALACIPELADRLTATLAGRSAEPKKLVTAYMVLGAVFVTCASDVDVPAGALREELIHGALRTLGGPAR
ncbi:TetR family transcriptional regulator [Streptomyces sp. TRM 70361]|uniref:TetR/AcrR family transcriptional regulator n=1 Tax=Streptomyces sp. TRM 70361 TaxID=3116553 RepID=UPI002E7ABCF7|nr:TetR family transcriptional regulator [Streptomyces sp. TRM 70361]MEE1939772.1 TetR family transcriptional regulator [Streptomyces sp. TRM 70361]